MVPYYGDFAANATVYIPINTFDSNDPAASVTVTNLLNTDVHIHKDGGTTQRNNAAGITMTIDYDSITGNHLLIIDTSDNTVGDFFQAGHEYQVRVEGITVDAGTINAWVGSFSIERAGGALALIKSATYGLSALKTLLDTTGIKVASFADNAITAASINADAITSAKIADNAIAAEHLAANAIDLATFAADCKTGSALKANVETITAGIIANASFNADVGSTAYATNIIALAAKKAIDNYDPPTNAEFELRSLLAADYTVVSDLGTVQTGDSFAIVNGDHGLVSIQDDIDSILVDTNELQTDWHDGGRLDLLLDGASAPSAATVADAVWDEALAGHSGAGTAGAALTAAGSAGDPWSTLIPGAYGAGTAGLLLGTTIPNAIDAIDNFIDTEVAAILEDTGTTLPASLAALDAKIDTIDGIVDNILTDTGTTLDTLVKDIPTNAELASAFTEIKGATWAAETDTLEAIRNKETDIETDTQDLQTQVGVDGAGLTALPWNAAWDTEVQSECTDALNAYDPPTNAEMELRTLAAADYTVVSDLGTVQTGDSFAIVNGDHGLVSIQDDVDAILADTNELQTDDTPTAVAAVKTVVDTIQAKTDSLTFTEAGMVDANVQYINDVQLTGSGTELDPMTGV